MSTILLLGGTGKTARRIAPRLRAAGATARTAARNGADVRFDWHDPATYDAALDGADVVYFVPPALDLGYGPLALEFIDRAEAAGVRHITMLSARGVEHAPPEHPHRATELELGRRTAFTHSILRPGWFMQDFDEYVFAPSIVADGTVVAPVGRRHRGVHPRRRHRRRGRRDAAGPGRARGRRVRAGRAGGAQLRAGGGEDRRRDRSRDPLRGPAARRVDRRAGVRRRAESTTRSCSGCWPTTSVRT